ncbi:MAG: hypothetical protein AAB944_02755 [Patescibacteria group bacterium]
MNRTFKLVFLLFLAVAIVGCADGSTIREMTGFASPAKDRKITLYAADGKVINVWEGRYALSAQNSTLVLKKGKEEVVISGGICVSEDK